MKRLIRLAIAASTLLLLTTNAQAAPASDPSDGACDPYSGRPLAVCLRAHRTSNHIDRLNARVEGGDNVSWRLLWKLDAAERRLESLMTQFENLTGEQVPGFAECELDVYTNWRSLADTLIVPGVDEGIISSELSVIANTSTHCRVGFEFTEQYVADNECQVAPEFNMYQYSESATSSLAEYQSGGLKSTGVPVLCSSTYLLISPTDSAQLKACAKSVGCDQFTQ